MAKPLSASAVRQRAIAEWRGYFEPRAIMAPASMVGSLLTKAMEGLGLSERVHETEVIEAWKDAVGDFFAAHSSPSRLRAGVLYVRVLQPSVHFEMERMRTSITARLKERFGAKTVRDVKFRLG